MELVGDVGCGYLLEEDTNGELLGGATISIGVSFGEPVASIVSIEASSSRLAMSTISTGAFSGGPTMSTIIFLKNL